MTLTAYDYDGVIDAGVRTEHPFIIITGRLFSEYDERLREWAQIVPVYMRGVGEFRDHQKSGEFKAMMINWLGVTKFYEDRDHQIAIIKERCPDCEVIKVG